jgi:hypothetical protein
MHWSSEEVADRFVAVADMVERKHQQHQQQHQQERHFSRRQGPGQTVRPVADFGEQPRQRPKPYPRIPVAGPEQELSTLLLPEAAAPTAHWRLRGWAYWSMAAAAAAKKKQSAESLPNH